MAIDGNSPRLHESAPAPVDLATRILMAIGGVMISVTLTALTPVLPHIEAELAHSSFDRLLVKLLVTITGFTMVIGAPLAGFLTDRIGVKPVLATAATIFTITGTAGFYLPGLQTLIASRLFVGLAAAAIAATSMTLINTRLQGLDRAKWMGIHVAVATIAGLIAHPVAGGLGELGWRWPFLLYLAGLPVLLLAVAIRRRTPVADRAGAGPEADSKPLLSWFPVRFLFLALCLGSITYLPVVYLPFVVREAGISSPFIISLVGLGDTIMTVTFALFFARVRKNRSSQSLFAFSFGCAALGLSIATLAPGFWTIVFGMMVFGLGLGWFVPNLMTAAADCVGADQQGRTVGIVKGAHYLAAPACVIAVEPFAQVVGPRAGIGVAAALSLVLLVVFLARLARLTVMARPVAPLPQ